MSEETISARELRAQRESKRIIDIRKEPDDRAIPGSSRFDGDALASGHELPFTQDESIVFYCGRGNSCRRVAAALRERGYDAVALEGGYASWRDAGFETEPLRVSE